MILKSFVNYLFFLPDNFGGGGALIVGAGGAAGKDVLCEDVDFDL